MIHDEKRMQKRKDSKRRNELRWRERRGEERIGEGKGRGEGGRSGVKKKGREVQNKNAEEPRRRGEETFIMFSSQKKNDGNKTGRSNEKI